MRCTIAEADELFCWAFFNNYADMLMRKIYMPKVNVNFLVVINRAVHE